MFRRVLLAGAVSVLLLGGVIAPSHAATGAAIDEGTAGGLCAASYPGANPLGNEPLADCQWDMGRINAVAANATQRGRGVRVGVIDGVSTSLTPTWPGQSRSPLRARSSSAPRRRPTLRRWPTATVRTRRLFRTWRVMARMWRRPLPVG